MVPFGSGEPSFGYHAKLLGTMDRNAYDIQMMQRALQLAREAAEAGEVPVGALIVDPYGLVLGEGKNSVEQHYSQVEHAEIRAIRSSGKALSSWRLVGCTLYVTLEPCMMCVSLAALSRIERIVYGADSPRFGYTLDREGVLGLYTKQIRCITRGVCAAEASRLLHDSFAITRRADDGCRS